MKQPGKKRHQECLQSSLTRLPAPPSFKVALRIGMILWRDAPPISWPVTFSMNTRWECYIRRTSQGKSNKDKEPQLPCRLSLWPESRPGVGQDQIPSDLLQTPFPRIAEAQLAVRRLPRILTASHRYRLDVADTAQREEPYQHQWC